jgi:glycosyltransferase involved in cell wall biosynthesis
MTLPVALLLSPVRPDALGTGVARRAWLWVCLLAPGHRLLTVVIGGRPGAADGRTAVPGDVIVLANPGAIGRRPVPDWITPGAGLANDLAAALQDVAPARVVVFRLTLHGVAALLPAAWRAVTEIDFDDYESRTRCSLAWLALRAGRWRLAAAQLRAASAYAAAETAALGRYRAVHVAAPEDAAALRARCRHASLVVTANRIAAPATIAPAAAAAGPGVLFVGTLGYLPNEDAVLWLMRSIAPRLRRLVPEARIAVAGAAAPSLAARMRQAGMICLDPLADLAEAYAGASVAVAPLRGGGGTKIKVLEAWQHQRPVVATRHACRGLGALPDRHLLQADTATGFAQACARLLRDPALAARLAAAGHALLHSRFALPAPSEASASGSCRQAGLAVR